MKATSWFNRRPINRPRSSWRLMVPLVLGVFALSPLAQATPRPSPTPTSTATPESTATPNQTPTLSATPALTPPGEVLTAQFK